MTGLFEEGGSFYVPYIQGTTGAEVRRMTKMAAGLRPLGGVSQAAVNDFKHVCAISISLAFFVLFLFIVWDPTFQEQSPAVPSSSLATDIGVVNSASPGRRTEPDLLQVSLSDGSPLATDMDIVVTSANSKRTEPDSSQVSLSDSSPLATDMDIVVTSANSRRTEPDSSQVSLSDIESVSVQKLIHDIRDMTKLASGGVSYDLTSEEKDEWHRRNPCRSRSELLPMYDLRKKVQKLQPNVLLDDVLNEYSKLHRVCTQKLGSNVTEFFINNRTAPGCNFLLGSPMHGTGLGNKMIVTISALIYAILTQRILLVPSRTHLPTFLCEPFVGSSWMLNTSTFPMPDGPSPILPWEGPVAKSEEWADDAEFLQAMDVWIEGQQTSQGSNNLTDFSGLELPSLTYALSVTIRWQPENRFYCEAEQRLLAEVPWLYWGGCIYSVPKLFGTELFGPTLRELFPDRMVMARMLRSSFLPSDDVFAQLLQVNNKFFNPGDRRVGIQLRNRQGEDYFERMKEELNRRILVCGTENGFLPNTTASSREGVDRAAPPKTKVFIASLYRGLFLYLNNYYAAGNATTGENIELVQVSSREQQALGAEEDVQALVEILVLSLSDHLLVTPASTFGSIAQGYGAINPWFIETRENTDTVTYGACERAQSIDICHQYTEVSYECPHSLKKNTKIELDKDSALKRCLDIDHTAGIQLISSFQSDA